MKKTLHFLGIAALITVIAVAFSSCSDRSENKPATSLVLAASDTTGLADFQAWKAQNERKVLNQYYAQQASQAAPVKTVSRTAPVKKANTPTPATTAPAKKKGWSKAAKGAVIGTATGAAAGAIINKKNRVLGGVIGGVIGGGVGYGIGRGMDKKDGRY